MCVVIQKSARAFIIATNDFFNQGPEDSNDDDDGDDILIMDDIILMD